MTSIQTSSTTASTTTMSTIQQQQQAKPSSVLYDESIDSNNDKCADPTCSYTSTTEEMIEDIILQASSSSSSSSIRYIDETAIKRDILAFNTIATTALIGYRSVGIGMFGAIMRYIGMPLEKIALYMNSSQVHVLKNGMNGPSQFQQAISLTFQDGVLSPYRVVGMSSMMAWFMQYSVMGIAFQFFDQVLSNALHVQPMYYGRELMEPPPSRDETAAIASNSSYYARESFKAIMSPLLAASLESFVSNRAEVQRYYGPKLFQQVQLQYSNTLRTMNPLIRYTGPAYNANVLRNIIMCQTSFIITPYTYKMYFPQESKNKTTLFYYGLSLNIFFGNVIAITQQALWGRSLDYLQQNKTIHYTNIIKEGYQREGTAAFFTPSKWMSRVLMNAPAQGTLPWFYNEILPIGEYTFLSSFYHTVYRPFLKSSLTSSPTLTGNRSTTTTTTIPIALPETNLNSTSSHRDHNNQQQEQRISCNIQRTRTHYGTLPTANPEFDDNDDLNHTDNQNDTKKKYHHHHHHHHHHKVIQHAVSSSSSSPPQHLVTTGTSTDPTSGNR